MLLVGDDIVNMSTLSTCKLLLEHVSANGYQHKNCTSRMAAHVCYLLYYEVM